MRSLTSGRTGDGVAGMGKLIPLREPVNAVPTRRWRLEASSLLTESAHHQYSIFHRFGIVVRTQADDTEARALVHVPG